MRLSHHDYNASSRVMRELYAETSLPALRARLFPLLSRLVPMEYGSLNDFNDRLPRYVSRAYPDRPELQSLLPRLQAAIRTHPLYDHYQSASPVPKKISDRVTLRQFRETAVYQEYYHFANVRHQMVFYLGKEGDTRIGVALNRWHRDFSERDRAVFGFLSPHIAQAYQNARIATDAALKLDDVGEGLDSIHRAVILTRADGAIRWISPQARAWLDEFFSECRNAPHHLPVQLRNWVHQSVKTANSGRPNFSELQLAAQAGCRLLIYCGRTAGGDFVLALLRERVCIPPEMAQSFNLTPREAEILFWMSEAKTNPEIAVILGASVRTIHKHTEHLFAKLHVENRLATQRLGLELRRV